MHIGLLSIFQNYRDEHDDAEVMQGELALAKAADQLGYDSYWATDDDVLRGNIEIDLGQPCAFNVVEVQEYIPLGQRVKAWAVDARIDLPRFSILTPFPGTPLFRRLEAEGRILNKDWERYDGQHVVFQPARMSVGELERGTREAWLRSYSFGSMFRRMLHSPCPLPVLRPQRLPSSRTRATRWPPRRVP